MQFVLKTECFVGVGCGNPFPLASVGYGKVALPRGKPVSAQAWGAGGMFPVPEVTLLSVLDNGTPLSILDNSIQPKRPFA